jgi:hypothetical protein
VVEEAKVAISGKGQDIASVLSSGTSAQEKRRQNRDKKEKQEREDSQKKG